MHCVEFLFLPLVGQQIIASKLWKERSLVVGGWHVFYLFYFLGFCGMWGVSELEKGKVWDHASTRYVCVLLLWPCNGPCDASFMWYKLCDFDWIFSSAGKWLPWKLDNHFHSVLSFSLFAHCDHILYDYKGLLSLDFYFTFLAEGCSYFFS